MVSHAHFAAVWIVVANSWQQTPAGFHLVTGGRVRWRSPIRELVFNPSSVDRLVHTLLGRGCQPFGLERRHVLSFAAGIAREAAAEAGLVRPPSLQLAAVIALQASWLINRQAAAMEGHFKRPHAPPHSDGKEDRRRVIGPASSLSFDPSGPEARGYGPTRSPRDRRRCRRPSDVSPDGTPAWRSSCWAGWESTFSAAGSSTPAASHPLICDPRVAVVLP